MMVRESLFVLLSSKWYQELVLQMFQKIVTIISKKKKKDNKTLKYAVIRILLTFGVVMALPIIPPNHPLSSYNLLDILIAHH